MQNIFSRRQKSKGTEPIFLYLKENVYSRRQKFIVKTNNEKIRYTVGCGKLFSFGRKRYIYDSDGNIVASVKESQKPCHLLKSSIGLSHFIVEVKGKAVCEVARTHISRGINTVYLDISGSYIWDGDVVHYTLKNESQIIMELSDGTVFRSIFESGSRYKLLISNPQYELLGICFAMIYDMTRDKRFM